MKKIFASLALLLAAVAAVAQVTIEIAPNPKMVTVPNPPTVADVVAHAKIHNLVNETRTYKWTRTVVSISPDCKTQVCDRNNCYLAAISTKQFTMLPMEDSTMDVHLIGNDPNGGTQYLLCCAVVHLKVEDVNDANNTVTGVYIFDGCTSGTLTANSIAARIFPNPASTSFSLENAENVAFVRLFSMDGREVKTFGAQPGGAYPVADLPAGTYIVLLENQQRAPQAALELRLD